jgi:hypothetical protein
MLVSLFVNKIYQSIEELDNWIETHPQSLDEIQWVQNIRKQLLQAKKSTSIDELEYITGIITRMIVDSGPLDKDFLPSFQDLRGKLEKLSNK